MAGLPLAIAAVNVSTLYLGTSTTVTAADPAAHLMDFGVLGIFAAVLLVYARSQIKREQAEKDALAVEVKDLRVAIDKLQDQRLDAVENRYLPGLEATTDVIRENTSVLREVAFALRGAAYDPPRRKTTTTRARTR